MIDSRILIGLIAVLISIGSVVYVGINEPDRQAEFRAAFQGRKIEQGASLFASHCSPCHGIKGEGVPGRGPTLNSAHLFKNRLNELGYSGTLESYIKLTVAGGRPAQSSSGPWPQNMPTWSVDYGGPLRNDQVDSVVAYILSWEEFAVETGEGGALTQVEGDTPEERGRNLFQVRGCIGCHKVAGEGQVIGPDLTNVYAEKGEDYIRQSILDPNAVVAEGFQPNIMPPTFGELLSEDDINDIIAYLASFSQ